MKPCSVWNDALPLYPLLCRSQRPLRCRWKVKQNRLWNAKPLCLKDKSKTRMGKELFWEKRGYIERDISSSHLTSGGEQLAEQYDADHVDHGGTEVMNRQTCTTFCSKSFQPPQRKLCGQVWKPDRRQTGSHLAKQVGDPTHSGPDESTFYFKYMRYIIVLILKK